MRNPWLCILIVAALGLCLLFGMIGLVILAVYGKDMPAAITTTMTFCAGSLASFLVQPPRGSVGIGADKALRP